MIDDTDVIGEVPTDPSARFFWDKAHGVKMIRIASWIVQMGLPLSGKGIRRAMTELGIEDLQPRNEREIYGIVVWLRGQQAGL